MTTVTARWLAGGLLLLTVTALAVSAWSGVANGGLMNAFAFTPLLLAFAAVGAIVAGHRPANPIGWLFQAEGLGFAVGVATDTFARHAIRTGAAPSSVAWADWLGAILGELGFLFVLAVLLFPDGRLPSPGGGWSPGSSSPGKHSWSSWPSRPRRRSGPRSRLCASPRSG